MHIYFSWHKQIHYMANNTQTSNHHTHMDLLHFSMQDIRHLKLCLFIDAETSSTHLGSLYTRFWSVDFCSFSHTSISEIRHWSGEEAWGTVGVIIHPKRCSVGLRTGPCLYKPLFVCRGTVMLEQVWSPLLQWRVIVLSQNPKTCHKKQLFASNTLWEALVQVWKSCIYILLDI